MSIELGDTGQKQAAIAAETIASHNDRAGWVIDDKPHGLAMLLMDLMLYAEANSIDFAFELQSARETVEEVYAA